MFIYEIWEVGGWNQNLISSNLSDRDDAIDEAVRLQRQAEADKATAYPKKEYIVRGIFIQELPGSNTKEFAKKASRYDSEHYEALEIMEK